MAGCATPTRHAHALLRPRVGRLPRSGAHRLLFLINARYQLSSSGKPTCSLFFLARSGARGAASELWLVAEANVTS